MGNTIILQTQVSRELIFDSLKTLSGLVMKYLWTGSHAILRLGEFSAQARRNLNI